MQMANSSRKQSSTCSGAELIAAALAGATLGRSGLVWIAGVLFTLLNV